jgi:hypothetical protein
LTAYTVEPASKQDIKVYGEAVKYVARERNTGLVLKSRFDSEGNDTWQYEDPTPGAEDATHLAAYQKHLPPGIAHMINGYYVHDHGDHIEVHPKSGEPQHLTGEDADYMRTALGQSAHAYAGHPNTDKYISHAENQLETVLHETARNFNSKPENAGIQNPLGHPDMEGHGEADSGDDGNDDYDAQFDMGSYHDDEGWEDTASNADASNSKWSPG